MENWKKENRYNFQVVNENIQILLVFPKVILCCIDSGCVVSTSFRYFTKYLICGNQKNFTIS